MSILSEKSIIEEMQYISTFNMDISAVLEQYDRLLETAYLTEEEYNKVTKRLKLDILDIEKYVKENDCKCVSNPRAFTQSGVESPDGVLSNVIFGFTAYERSSIYAYIDLHGWFMDPSLYKTWIRLDPKIKNIVHGVKYYVLDDLGNLIEDEENGETGIDFLRKNIKKIKFRESNSDTKKLSIKYLETNRDKMFIQKYIVIPPLYRDKNTSAGSRKTVGLGGINKIYNNLIVAANALTATQDYGFDASDSMKARVQEIILGIYDWFCGNSNESIKAEQGQGLSGKLGIMKRANMSKTANFSTRLVISPADLKVDKPEDLMITFDKSAIPLYAVITEFRDFVMFNVRLFFENEFRGIETYPVKTKDGTTKIVVPDAPDINFSDERIKKEMDRFLHGYNNRFVPIEIPVSGTNEIYYMTFKGRGVDPNNSDNNKPPYNRRLTWCDVFYLACVEATRDKQVLVTRFPIDFFSNQFTTGIEVSSTKETEQVEYNGELYRWYPKIREEDIGKDTSNSFVDTLRFSNLYLSGIGGDYDGDQCTCKGVYTRQANVELQNYMNSKQNYITFGGAPLREPGSDVYQSIFALTRVLSTTNITPSSEIKYA